MYIEHIFYIYATRRSVNGSLRHGPWVGARDVMLQYKRRCGLRVLAGRLEMTTYYFVPPSLQEIALAYMLKILMLVLNTLYCTANKYISSSGSVFRINVVFALTGDPPWP